MAIGRTTGLAKKAEAYEGRPIKNTDLCIIYIMKLLCGSCAAGRPRWDYTVEEQMIFVVNELRRNCSRDV